MKKFKFRLQKVLEHREKVKDDRRAELLEANHILADAEAELQRLLSLEVENALQIQQVSSASMVFLNAQISEGLRNRVAHQREVIKEKQALVAKALEAFTEANVELKAVSTLKERKLQEYNKVTAEREAAFLDELAIQRSIKSN